MNDFRLTPPLTLGIIILLAGLGALAAFSFQTTLQIGSTLKAAGISPQTHYSEQAVKHYSKPSSSG